ncbi:AAR2 protein-domain-containing protein [Cercophora samala]|uniref:AAR2 protein-domain-containing protein n=1 Tax=Cercophora samala TaxID=330535 RepID=A0AA39ZGP6_9PEZI|nr:AAR2 protein-domain-containing protein [Cercophora samala]
MATPFEVTRQVARQRSRDQYDGYDTDIESTTSTTIRKAVKRDLSAEEEPHERTTGDALRILDLPDNFIIGLDLTTITTTTSLQGFQQIPPGAHFLWVQQPGAPFRSGYWFVTKRRRSDFRIQKWDKYNEVLVDPTPEENDAVGRGNFEKLAPYTLDGLTTSKTRPAGSAVADYSFAPTDSLQALWSLDPVFLWTTLTDNITPASLAHVTSQPLSRGFHVDSTTDSFPNLTSEGGIATEVKSDSQFNFFVAPERWVEAKSGSRIESGPGTAGLDEKQMRKVLSDLQFTFLTGTLLSNLACLEKWWDLVLKVVLMSWDLVGAQPKFVGDMITILHAQLYFTEVCLEDENTTASGIGSVGGKEKSKTEAGPNPDRVLYQVKRGSKERLKKALEKYRQEIQTCFGRKSEPEAAEVGKAIEELEGFLFGLGWDLMGWGSVHDKEDGNKGSSSEDEDGNDQDDWNSEDEDDGPVIVELDEEGRQVGLVSFHD